MSPDPIRKTEDMKMKVIDDESYKNRRNELMSFEIPLSPVSSAADNVTPPRERGRKER